MPRDQAVPAEEVLSRLNANPEFRRIQRRTRPLYDLVIQIINRRDELNMTQGDLANKANTHQSRISKIESGEHDIRLSTLVQIAEALDSEVCIQLVPFCEVTYTLPETTYRVLPTTATSFPVGAQSYTKAISERHLSVMVK